MKSLVKPAHLNKGDLIVTISPCNGWAGDANVRWKYDLGVRDSYTLWAEFRPFRTDMHYALWSPGRD